MADLTRVQRGFWSAKEAAVYIGTSQKTLITFIRRLGGRKRGHNDRPLITTAPPHRRFGNRLIFPIEDFKAWALGPYGARNRPKLPTPPAIEKEAPRV